MALVTAYLMEYLPEMANTTMVLAMVLPMTQALPPQLPFPSTSLVTQLLS